MSLGLLLFLLLSNQPQKLNSHPPATQGIASQAHLSGDIRWTSTTWPKARDDYWKTYRPTCFDSTCPGLRLVTPSGKTIATFSDDGKLTIAEGHSAEEIIKWLLIGMQEQAMVQREANDDLIKSLERIRRELHGPKKRKEPK